jgi:hypothetical protein
MWRRKQVRPPSSYEDVRLVAEALSHINADLIKRHFAVSADIAQKFMERLVAEKRFGDLQPDGWYYPPVRKLRRRRPRRKPMATNKPETEESIADEREPVVDLAGRIDELEQDGHALRARINRRQHAFKTVIGQREHWKSWALAAEELLGSERSRCTKGDDRFDALRRLIAKELHPDFCNGGHLEQLMRQECFKTLWPEIERLADWGSGPSSAGYRHHQSITRTN